MTGKRGRVSKLEAVRRRWEAEHIPLSSLTSFLLDVLNIVREEAGPEAVGRIGGRMVADKLRRVEALQGGHR